MYRRGALGLVARGRDAATRRCLRYDLDKLDKLDNDNDNKRVALMQGATIEPARIDGRHLQRVYAVAASTPLDDHVRCSAVCDHGLQRNGVGRAQVELQRERELRERQGAARARAVEQAVAERGGDLSRARER